MRHILLALAALLLVGFPLIAQSEPDDLSALEDELEMNPDQPELLLKLGIIYHNQGAEGDKEAVKYEHLIALKEKKPDIMDSNTYVSVLFGLGFAYANKGDGEKSGAYLRQVVEMAPNSEFAEPAKKILKKLEEPDKK